LILDVHTGANTKHLFDVLDTPHLYYHLVVCTSHAQRAEIECEPDEPKNSGVAKTVFAGALRSGEQNELISFSKICPLLLALFFH
jgi:hypothetical protein